MTRSEFVSLVMTNVLSVLEYKPGHNGHDHYCDNIGLLIGALEYAGIEWPGSRSVNWAARHIVGGLVSVGDIRQLKVGDILFRAHLPDSDKWALPEEFSYSQDRNDYYRVGILTHLNPLVIVQCVDVRGGIKEDVDLRKWRFVGRLKMIEME